MYSHTVINRFIDDYSLPIQIVQEPYFEYFMNLYNNYSQTWDKFKLLNCAIKDCGSEDNFLKYYYEIRDKIITSIKELKVYEEFNTMNMDKYDVPQSKFSKKDIFNLDNIDKCFISIDLKKANFQALKFFNPEIILNCNTYEEFIGKFTNLDYMKQSKYLRQVIFGNMNPSRQIKIERYITEQIKNLLLEIAVFKIENIKSLSNDEIVIETNCDQDFNFLTQQIKNDLNIDVDIEVYQLKRIGSQNKFFVKQFINKSGYELKNIPLVYFAQCYKYYNDLPICENDKVFYYEHQICRFLNDLKF